MISAFNLRDIQEPVEGDLGALKLYLQQIVGQPFLFFRESYGDELTIHLGHPKERQSPRLKNRVRGSYVVTVRGSLWTMVAAEKGMLILSDPPTELNGAELKKLSFNDLQQTHSLALMQTSCGRLLSMIFLVGLLSRSDFQTTVASSSVRRHNTPMT